MKVYAFVGKSGTGKSHNSMRVAKENHLHYIIDDGLLISDNRIIEGKSAKRESTKMASVRRAVFSDEEHTKSVKAAIKRENVDSILIIGTSERMVNMIAERLELGEIQKYIYIEDVSTPEAMSIAKHMREKQGKHVIPVPTFEVKKQFSGYFIDPILVMFNKKGKSITEEKTIIRPTYSYLGDYKIAPKVIVDLCRHEAEKNKAIYEVFKVRTKTEKQGSVIIDVDVSINYPCKLDEAAKEFSHQASKSIEYMTSLVISAINVNIKGIHINNKED